jgi:hypothetical protein
MQRKLIKKEKKFEALLFVSAALLMHLLMFNRNLIYFRDYSIIYDGASRILSGEIPYQNFGLPVGPITFLLSAIFLKISGGYWESLYFAQYVFNCIVILCILGICNQLKVDFFTKIICCLSAVLFHLIFLTHPWYNSMAVVFLFLAQYLILGGGNLFQFLAGFSSALAILSKQDIGLMLAISCLFEIYIFYDHDRFKNYFLFLIGFITVVIALFLTYSIDGPLYWINFGQHGGVSRNLFQNQPTALTFFGIFFTLYGLKLHKKIYLVSGLITSISSISINTSGLYFTHYYYIFPVILIATSLFKEKSKIRYASLFLSIYLLVSPLKSDIYLIQNFISNNPEHYLFNSRLMISSSNLSDMKKCSKKLRGVLSPVETCELINDIEYLIAIGKLPKNGSILNLSELRVLNTLISYKAPAGHPLWYDEGITLYPRETLQLEAELNSGLFDLILFQASDFDHIQPKWLKQFIGDLNGQYIIKKYKSPSDATDCNSTSSCLIWVLYKT